LISSNVQNKTRFQNKTTFRIKQDSIQNLTYTPDTFSVISDNILIKTTIESDIFSEISDKGLE